MGDLIERFFELAASDWLPWVLSALIILVALVLWADFRRRSARLCRALDDAIDVVQEVDGQVAFKKKFSHVFQKLAENVKLGEAWQAFAPTLTTAGSADEAIGYTRRPKETFNESLLAAAGINLRFFSAIPNFLVGAGLLFSFLGLVAALHFASAGVAARDVAQAQGALAELLAAATFKFTTSIAGLAASLVFSWREKAQLYRVQWRLQRFCALLEARMTPVTTESLLSAQLAELHKTNLQLRRLSKAVYVRVPEAIEDELADRLRESVGPLQTAIADAAASLSAWSGALPELNADSLQQEIQAASERVRPESAGPEAGASQLSGDGARPSHLQAGNDRRAMELGRLLDQKLGAVVEIISSGINRLTGKGGASSKRGHQEILELLQLTHDRVRDSRSAVMALLKHEPVGGEPVRTALGKLDDELRTAREQIHAAAERLEGES